MMHLLRTIIGTLTTLHMEAMVEEVEVFIGSPSDSNGHYANPPVVDMIIITVHLVVVIVVIQRICME